MPSLPRFVATLAVLSTSAAPGLAQTPTGTTGLAAKSLAVAFSLPNAQTNGVAIAPGGRMFLVIPKQKGQNVPEIAEYVGGQLKPFPDTTWNGWQPGADASHAFVHANSIRFGPDGTLWVVDFGSEGLGKAVVAHGAKLVGFDIASGKPTRTVYFDSVIHPDSAVDDVRFAGTHAYLTDAGWPGLIVLDMGTGAMRRVLNNASSTTAPKPLRAEGHVVLGKDGKPVYFNADQLEISPDGKTLYFQPNTGPMSTVPLADVDNAALSDAELSKRVKPFINNGTAGGTAIDSLGNIYVSDCDHDAVLKVTPAGRVSTLVQDPRLVWVDALWITPDGKLWMPAAQMDRTPSFNHGEFTVHFPTQVFTVDIGSGPASNDHR